MRQDCEQPRKNEFILAPSDKIFNHSESFFKSEQTMTRRYRTNKIPILKYEYWRIIS